ncbi:LUD domain-containing protein [Paenibacillus sp. CGMCC 1.16610]|uniref:Lactate utilization protein C n=1 Tax=Paenibacillus anseongense TaxID=2682845 RepID=A0ABW9U4C4_9BACL|nr:MULTISPECIES: LUD domain-containing protein [Paenibacillus]MBA2938916.1 LUD domain-containing protein [Paenibacillus sp. CGMCC 1.16610]MVQ34878.1 lactate utilization protein C [Paenibacillus anseongense]
MADTHQEWLDQLEAESRAKQKSFINGIASKLGRAQVTEKPAQPYRGAPDFWQAFEWPLDERIERFTENFQAAGGNVARLSSMEDVKQFIVNKAQAMSAKYIIRQNQSELDALDLEGVLKETSVLVWNREPETHWKARAAEADFGIVMADYATAYTGSITVLSSRDKGRSVSLLPTVLMAIIPVDRLKTRLGETLVHFDRAGSGNLPAGIHFISGPSRSADIENDLTIGVHGPGIVYALIVG